MARVHGRTRSPSTWAAGSNPFHRGARGRPNNPEKGNNPGKGNNPKKKKPKGRRRFQAIERSGRRRFITRAEFERRQSLGLPVVTFLIGATAALVGAKILTDIAAKTGGAAPAPTPTPTPTPTPP